MALILKPPKTANRSVFLAGSIEMGAAEDWQTKAEKLLEGFLIYNPRRDDWDSSWKQSIKNKQFVEQVEWELRHIEKADYRLVYFDPNTKAPITLMELGIMGDVMYYSTTVVVCPEGFYRKGNVDVFCRYNGIHQEPTLEKACKWLRKQS